MGKYTPHITMLAVQFATAAFIIISKAALNNGMSHFVLVVYRHGIATLFLSPFAYFLRKKHTSLTFYIFCRIFILAFGTAVSQNFYYAGLNYTSPTLASALSNALPALTFVIAVLSRWEKLRLRSLQGQAKVFGVLVCISGSLMVALYKGPVIPIFRSSRSHAQGPHNGPNGNGTLTRHWIKGCVFLVVSLTTRSLGFILQAIIAKIYPAELSITTLMCFLATVQSAAIALAFERNSAAWVLKWNIQLFSVVYAGIVLSGLVYYLQTWCIGKRGPVFASMFNPVLLLIVPILSIFIFSERLHLGIALGGILVVAGLYTLLWGKKNDVQEDMSKIVLAPVNSINESVPSAPMRSEENMNIAAVA